MNKFVSLALLMLLLPVFVAGQSQESSGPNTLAYDWKTNCRLATAAALSPVVVTVTDQTLAPTANGALTVDGIAVVAGDRLLVKDQAAPAQNGLYRVLEAGGASAKYLLQRDSDGNEWRDYPGSTVGITSEGTANKNTQWRCDAATTGTLGTTAIPYVAAGGGGGGGASTQTGTHAAPSTANPLTLSFTGPTQMVWYGVAGTINLPAAAGYATRGVIIYNTGAFIITVDTNGVEVLVRDGVVHAGGAPFTLSSGAGNYVALVSDGARWVTLGYKGTLGP